MMELAQLNENHKLLGELAGTWDYTVKMWMVPDAPPNESKGTATRKAHHGRPLFRPRCHGRNSRCPVRTAR